jgi:hypothetical protein
VVSEDLLTAILSLEILDAEIDDSVNRILFELRKQAARGADSTGLRGRPPSRTQGIQ